MAFRHIFLFARSSYIQIIQKQRKFARILRVNFSISFKPVLHHLDTRFDSFRSKTPKFISAEVPDNHTSKWHFQIVEVHYESLDVHGLNSWRAPTFLIFDPGTPSTISKCTRVYFGLEWNFSFITGLPNCLLQSES